MKTALVPRVAALIILNTRGLVRSGCLSYAVSLDCVAMQSAPPSVIQLPWDTLRELTEVSA
jgi:hypothetical protein